MPNQYIGRRRLLWDVTRITNFGRGIDMGRPQLELGEGHVGGTTQNMIPHVESGDPGAIKMVGGSAMFPFTGTAFPTGAGSQVPQRAMQVTTKGVAVTYKGTPARTDFVSCNPSLSPAAVWANATIDTTLFAPFFEVASDSAGVIQLWMCATGVAGRKYNTVTGVTAAWGGTPPTGGVCKIWKNRMMMAGTNAAGTLLRLYFSDINNPESWPSTNFIDIKSTDDEDDAIIALEVIGENLLVFKRRSVWLVFDPISFENRRVGGQGCMCKDATCELDGRVYFVNKTGMYSTDGNDIRYESKHIEPIFLDARRQTTTLTFFKGMGEIDTHLLATTDGRIIMNSDVLSNGNIFIAYPRLADEQAGLRMPWYVVVDTFAYRDAVIVEYNSGSTGYVNPPTTGIRDEGNILVGFSVDVSGGVTQFKRVMHPALFAHYNTAGAVSGQISCILDLPILKSFMTEHNLRIRRINVSGEQGGQLLLKVFKNPQFSFYGELATVGSAYSSTGVAYGTWNWQWRPETRAKSQLIQLSQSVNSFMSVNEVEIHHREAGR